MARISPFKAYRYNPALISDPGAVIAPPYDVITPQKKEALLERHPNNVIRLLLPEGEGDSRYQQAANLLDQYVASGIIIPDPAPALYLYSQIFAHPFTAQPVERRGLLGAITLEPFSTGRILPHERTLSGPKADRLKLMRATDANLEAIFGMYTDQGALSKAYTAAGPPLLSVTDSDGTEHRMWRVADPAVQAALQDDVNHSVVYIVDGHHRYETALNYQALRRAASPQTIAPQPFDAILMYLCPANDPGLVILPTHRVVHSVPDFSLHALLDALSPDFEMMTAQTPEQLQLLLEQHQNMMCFGLLTPDGHNLLACLRPDVQPGRLVNPDLPPELQELDVTMVHSHVLEHILKIPPQAQENQTNLRYVKSFNDALQAMRQPDVQLVVLMNPTRLDQVERVAQSGHVMPQKSTFFYPKLASGLVFNLFRDYSGQQL